MHPYIPHLISDIQNACRDEKKIETAIPESFDSHFEEVERYLDMHKNSKPFSSFCGLSRQDFPPAEQLTDEDMSLVIEHFHSLLFSWNTRAHIPEQMPVPMQYDIIVDILDNDYTLMEYGFLNIDFCSGCPDGCKLGEYCPCIKYWEEG